MIVIVPYMAQGRLRSRFFASSGDQAGVTVSELCCVQRCDGRLRRRRSMAACDPGTKMLELHGLSVHAVQHAEMADAMENLYRMCVPQVTAEPEAQQAALPTRTTRISLQASTPSQRHRR